MTRREFLEKVNDFNTLIEFCDDNDVHACDRVFSEYELNDRVMEYVCEFDDFHDVLRFLENVIDTNEWYEDDGTDIVGIDHRFDDYKEYAVDEADEYELWDEEEDEEDEYDEEDTASPQPISEASSDIEDISDEAFSALLIG